MKRRGPRREQEAPEATQDLIAGLLSRIGGTGRALEYRVFDAFNAAAGDVLRARTSPDSLRDRTLFVRVTSSALAHEIALLRPGILARMDAVLGPGVVTEIRTRVAPLPDGHGQPR